MDLEHEKKEKMGKTVAGIIPTAQKYKSFLFSSSFES